MFDLVGMLRNLFGGQQATNPEQQKDQIEAQSGGNVQFYDNTDVGEKYGNALSDAVRFYQKEFNMVPHATIGNEPEALPDTAIGMADMSPDEKGQISIDFRHLTSEDEEEGEAVAKLGERTGSHPKNSGTLSATPVHEFGHALFGTLFPPNDTSSNREGEQENGKFYSVLADDVYFDALNDIGAGDDNEKAVEKTKEISEYAGTNPAETVAEALVDYYYNRDDATDLAKAIVKRLKSKSYRYAMDQTGGFDLSSGANNFVKNLRRYRVIQ